MVSSGRERFFAFWECVREILRVSRRQSWRVRVRGEEKRRGKRLRKTGEVSRERGKKNQTEGEELGGGKFLESLERDILEE